MSDDAIPLARLLAMAYRFLLDGLHDRLREEGWVDVRPSYGFALLAARERPITISALGELLGVTKQAASKLAAAMVDAGYLVAAVDEDDSRQRSLRLSSRGGQLLQRVEAIYAELERGWAAAIGDDALTRLRRDLTVAVASSYGGTLPPVRPTV